MTPADTDASQGTETSDATTADSSTTPVLDEFGGTIGQGQVRTIRAPWGASTVTRVRHAVVADLRARELAEQKMSAVTGGLRLPGM